MSRLLLTKVPGQTPDLSGKDILFEHDPNREIGETLTLFKDEKTGDKYMLSVFDPDPTQIPLTKEEATKEDITEWKVACVIACALLNPERRFMKAFDSVYDCRRELRLANSDGDRAKIVEKECLLEEAEEALEELKQKYPEKYPGQWDEWIHRNGYWTCTFTYLFPEESEEKGKDDDRIFHVAIAP